MAERDTTAAPARLHTHAGQFSLSIALDEDHVIDTARSILEHRFHRLTEPLDAPEKVKDFLLMHLVPAERERFAALFLDSQHRAIAFETLFEGTIDSAAVRPREVVKRALQLNAAAVIAAHNHPSGSAEPSEADKRMTLSLHSALATVGVRLLDHLVLGSAEMVSLAERGWIDGS